MPTTISRTIRSGGGDYTTVNSWLSWAVTTYPDLVAADVILEVIFYNDWPNGLDETIDITGFTTSATQYVILSCASGETRTDGSDITSGFYFKPTTLSNGYCIKNSTQHTKIYNIGCAANIGYRPHAISNLASGFLIQGVKVETSWQGIHNYKQSPAVIPIVRNCEVTLTVASNVNNACFITKDWGSCEFYNNTAISTAAGVAHGFKNGTNGGATSNKVKYVNNVAMISASNTSYYNGQYYTTAGSSNNAASDGATASNLPFSATNLEVDVLTTSFTDYAGGDYSLSASSQLIGEGFDLSVDFTVDMNEVTRTVPWTIGAFTYSANTPVLNIYVGGIHITNVYHGINSISSVYHGITQI